MRLRLTALALALCLLLARRQATAGTTGSLEGRVTDGDTGAPLPGANVVLLPSRQGAATDDDGRYKIHNIRPGSYDVQVSMIGYATATSPGLELLPDRRYEMAFALEPSPIQMRAVEVTHTSPLIQTDITGTAYQVDAADLATRPVSDLAEVVALQPAVTAEGNVRGGRARETVYLVDGLPVQDVIQGGLGAELPLSAISQVSVQTGGFDAEYGNALSGIVNIVTRSAEDEHRLYLRSATDHLFGGDEVSRRVELEITASGPLRRGTLSYFTATNAVLTDTRWWQDFQHFFDSPVQRELNGLAKLDWQVSPDRRLTGEAIYSLQRWRDYEFTWRYNLDGLPRRERDSYRGALLWTHTLSPRTFYTASLDRFALSSRIGAGRDSTAALTPYDFDFFLLYIVSGERAWWADQGQVVYTLKADATHQVRPTQLVKVGGELRLYDIDSDIVRLEPQTTYFGRPLVFEPQLNYSTRYHYRPRAGSAYAQTEVDAGQDRSVVTFGVRLDFLDPRAERPAVELVPTRPDQYEEQVTGHVPASVKYHLSPRFGCSFPLTESSYFFVNFGQYVQYPLFDYLYSGLDNATLRDGVNVLRGNPDLEAERTRAWEVSVRRHLQRGVVASVAYYHKETRDQIDTKTFVATNSRIAGDYGFAEYVNSSLATSSGVELVVRRDEGAGVRGTISYAYMLAEGLSDAEDRGLNLAQWGFEVASTPYKLSWDQRHTIKADVDLDLPLGVAGHVNWQFHSGRPYTWYPSADGFTADNPDLPFVPNNRRMAAYNVLDLRVSRAFHSCDRSDLSVYVDSRNLLDERNVRWVDSSGRVGGELSDPGAYYTPRRTVVGLRAEFF